MIDRTLVRAATLLVLSGLALPLGGCEGHGSYTSEGKELAEGNMARMKAASRFDLAMQEYKSGDPKRALASIDQSIQLSDRTPAAHVLRGRILTELGRAGEAGASFDKALSIEPDKAETHYYKALAQERAQDRAGALASYQRAIELDGSAQQYVIAAAELLMEERRYDDAQTLLTSCAPEVRTTAGVHQTLGHIAMMRGEPAVGLAHFRDAATISPNDPALLEDLSRAQVACGRLTEADKTLERLLKLPKLRERADLVQLRARCLSEIDRPVEARELLLKLCDGPSGCELETWQRLYDLGRTLEDVGLQRRSASQMIAAAPDRPEGHLAMGICLRDMGEVDSAIASLERAVARAGNDPTPAKTLGLLQAKLGHRAAAAQAFALAAKLDPRDTRAVKLAEMYADPSK